MQLARRSCQVVLPFSRLAYLLRSASLGPSYDEPIKRREPIESRCKPKRRTPNLKAERETAMTLDAIQAAIITSMTASYLTAPSAVITDTASPKVTSKKPAKVKAPKSDGSQAAPSSHGAAAKVVPSIELPSVGTYDAVSFTLAMRNAGKRVTSNGKPIYDASLVREDQIKAIAGYIGYTLSDNFGTQELRAKMAAQRTMVPVKAGVERSSLPSVQGFVSGLPDHNQRLIQDLQGRERLAVDAMVDHDRQALVAKTTEEKNFHSTMAQVERERLESIRKDLSHLV